MSISISKIAKSIVEGYGPEKIILYGSYAKKIEREDSDIDLLIIKETEKRPIDRRIEVERLLCDRQYPLDILVYTPQEVRYLFSLGSPLIEEIMKEGRIIYMRKVTDEWVKNALDELDSASILFEHKKYRGTCYHCQQCVGKLLKALILEKGKKPERTHDLVELLKKTKNLGYKISSPMDDLIFLNSIYKGRYPAEEGLLPYGEPSQEDSQKALKAARNLMEDVKALLQAEMP